MRNVRAAVAAATALCLTGAVSSFGAASAATPGVGTSDVSTTVVGVTVGDDGSILGLRLLGDDARATIDPAVSPPTAYSRYTAVDISSDTVGALNLTSGAVESKQPGGDDAVTSGSVDLSNPATGVTVPDAVLDGTLGAVSLSSAASPTAATSALDAALTDASLVGGLATVQGVSSAVNTAATATESTGVRSVKVDQVVVLDLGSLLAGLKISLADLPLHVLVGLLEQLEATVAGFDPVTEVNDAVDALQAELTTLLNAGSSLPAGETVETIVDTVNGTPLGTIIDPATEDAIENLPDAADQVDQLVDQVQGAIAEIVEQVLATLDGLALLEVNGVEVGVTTKATDTAAASVAGIIAKLGGVKVGGQEIDGVDLASGADTVNATVTAVNTALGEVLGEVHPDLADLVTVKLFQRAAEHGVATEAGYVEAVDGITAVAAAVAPPAELADVLADIAAATDTVADLLGDVDADDVLDDLDQDMIELNTTVNLANVGALADGATVTVGSLSSTSNFAPSTGLPGGGTEDERRLAATGADDSVPMTGLAMLLVALGLGLRQWTQMSLRRTTS